MRSAIEFESVSEGFLPTFPSGVDHGRGTREFVADLLFQIV